MMRKFYGAAYTDVGTVKTVNQDSLMIRIADIGMHKTAFAVVCDGMGGLQQGELASATVVRAYEKWYEEELPELLEQSHTEKVFANTLEDTWSRIALECNEKIRKYGHKQGVNLGTTLTVEQAKNDSRKSVLLQCIGVNETLRPDFMMGEIPENAAFLVCTDGFWHEPPREVLYRTCYEDMQMLEWMPQNNKQNAASMQETLKGLASRSKQRGERDNLSAILIQVK